MAILNNLLVKSSSRFIGTSYFQDVSIAGSATLSSLSLSGTLTVNGATTINNVLNVTGTSTMNKIIASSFIVNNGIELYHNTPFIDFHFDNNSTVDYTSRIIEFPSGTLTIPKNLTIGELLTAKTGAITTLNGTSINAQNVNVTNNLRANHYDLQSVAQLGGSFYVSPTVKFPNSGTTLEVKKSGSTLTLTIKDSSITSATMAGVVWTAGSGVKVSGTINGVVTGTMDGTVSSINTSPNTLTLSVSGENSGNVQASPSGSPYNASQFKDLSVMLYTRKQDGTIKMTNVASGAIASFTDGGNNVPLKQFVVDIEPVQDLHGYDSPWIGGGGKNLLKPYKRTASASGVTYTVADDGKITLTGTATGNNSFTIWPASSGMTVSETSSYTISMYGAKNAKINEKDTVTQTITAGSTISNIGISITNGTSYNESFYIQIEKGTVATAYTPYENICPISGHTQAKVTRTGKNLIPSPNSQVVNGITVTHNNDGSISITGTASAGTVISGPSIGKLKSGTYTISISQGLPEKVWVSISNSMGLVTYSNVRVKTGTVDAIDNAHVHIYIDKGVTINTTLTILLEVGSTATAYEPYKGQTYTIDLGGTRYGGTLDVGTGVLTVDKGYKLLNGVNGDGVAYRRNGHTANTTRAFVTINDKAYGVDNIMSSSFHVSSADAVGSMYGRAASNGVEFYLDTSVPDTDAGIMAWFVDNPTDFVYELAEPFTVQLSKTEVRTLQGYNNIWSNTGDTNLIYESSQYDSTSNYNVGIWMNCYDQANSSSTIRVYNGSSRWPNVFLGNMTNADLPRVNGNAPYGYGLYSDNVFLRGIISATGGLIGNWTIGTTGMFYNSDAPGSTSITMIPGGTAASTTSIGGSSGSKQWIFTGKNLFGIDTTGKLYASSAEISGKITANTGYIGGTSGWTIASQQLSNGTLGADNSLYLGTKNLGSNTSIGGRQGSDWRLTVGSHFGVTNTGTLYANAAVISGVLKAGANSEIGPWKVTTTSIYKVSNTLGSGTSGAAYFGNLGLSIGNKFKVDASGDGAIILGELAEGKTHVAINPDSFDILNGNNVLATFGETSYIGDPDYKHLVISSSDGFSVYSGNRRLASFNPDGQQAFNELDNKIMDFGYLSSGAKRVRSLFLYDGSSPFSITLPWARSNNNEPFVTIYNSNLELFSQSHSEQYSEQTITFPEATCEKFIEFGVKFIYVAYDAEGKYPYFDFSGGFGEKGEFTFQEGEGSLALGEGAHAEGITSVASGLASHAEGYFSYANGKYAHAGGYKCIASGEDSFAHGFDLIASKTNQVVFGQYNLEEPGALIVGNGSDTTNRSNCLTVDWQGNVDALKFRGHQHVLWSGAWYMGDGQTITLSESALDQSSGIVLVWSYYDPTTQTTGDWNWNFHFIPKKQIELHNGGGSNFMVACSNYEYVGTKYLYVGDTQISGIQNNYGVYTASGISFQNNRFVLRYVIGV